MKNFHLLKIVYYKKYTIGTCTCKPTLLDNLGVSQLQTIKIILIPQSRIDRSPNLANIGKLVLKNF